MEKSLKQEFTEQILSRCQVVCSTINSAFNADFYYRKYDIVIMDEATQCTDADMMIPLYYQPQKLILIGDTKQLGVNCRTKSLQGTNFDVSFLERIVKTFGGTNPDMRCI